jgi:hypothetical protein
MPLRIHTAVAPNPTLIIIPRCNSPNSHAHLHDEQIVCVLKKAPVLKSSEQNKKTEPPMFLPNPFFSVVTIAADLIGTQKLGLTDFTGLLGDVGGEEVFLLRRSWRVEDS